MQVSPGSGRASMLVLGLPSRDFHDLVNALLEGPSVPAVVSFQIEWSASNHRHHFHYEPERWDANLVLNTAQARWAGETAQASFLADALSTSFSLFAEVGHERNGVFFPQG